MARTKSEIPRGSFVLRNQKNSKGEKVIYLRYYINRDYVYRTMDCWIKEKDWDQKNQCVRKNVEGALQLNRRLVAAKARIDQKLLHFEGVITGEVMKKIINDDFSELVETTDRDFVEYAQKYHEKMYAAKKYGYTMFYSKKKNIEAFETFVEHYAKLPRVTLDNLSVKIFDDYIEYRTTVKKNKSREGINKTLVPLYAAIDYAVKEGIVNAVQMAPIVTNFVPTKETEYNGETKKTEKVMYLTTDQLKKIKNYQSKCKYERTREILDFFLFSYYACGLRLSDLLTLEWSNINWEDHTLQKVQFKTKREFDMPIPLTEDALKILERWKGRNKRFVFNLLPEKFNLEDQKQLFMERNAKDKTFNRSLQAVAEAINLPFFPTMHTARHSFAVFAINNGIEIYLLSKLMGHSSVVSTEKTYAEFLKEKVEESVKTIFENTLL